MNFCCFLFVTPTFPHCQSPHIHNSDTTIFGQWSFRLSLFNQSSLFKYYCDPVQTFYCANPSGSDTCCSEGSSLLSSIFKQTRSLITVFLSPTLKCSPHTVQACVMELEQISDHALTVLIYSASLSCSTVKEIKTKQPLISSSCVKMFLHQLDICTIWHSKKNDFNG